MCPSLSGDIWADTIITRRWRHGILSPRSGAGGEVVTLTAGAGEGLGTAPHSLAPGASARHHSVCPHPRWGPEHGDHTEHRVTRDTWHLTLGTRHVTSQHSAAAVSHVTSKAVRAEDRLGPWAALGWKLGRLHRPVQHEAINILGLAYQGEQSTYRHVLLFPSPTRSIQFCFVESSTSKMISRPSARPHCNAASSAASVTGNRPSGATALWAFPWTFYMCMRGQQLNRNGRIGFTWTFNGALELSKCDMILVFSMFVQFWQQLVLTISKE